MVVVVGGYVTVALCPHYQMSVPKFMEDSVLNTLTELRAAGIKVHDCCECDAKPTTPPPV